MTKIQDIRNRTQRTNGTRALSSVTTIVRHHSATTGGDFDAFWRHWNGTLKWGTGGYHEIILRDGTVQICYDPHEITNGVGGQNTYSYHICLVGNGSFTAEQEVAWDDRVAHNMARLNVGVSNVKGHREMPGANTACPGIDMDTVRARINSGVKAPQTGGTQVTAPTPKPSKSIAQMVDEVIANKHGNGHENRRKSLGISAGEYAKVRDEVNRRAGASTPKPTKEYVNLPSSAATWRTYKTNVAPVAKNSDWSLTPARFGGLSYEVLARPQADVVTINTSRGRRNIYVARSTGATFTRR